jgi:hypothetical protein
VEQIHSKIPIETLEARKELRERGDLVRRRLGLLAGKDKLVMKMYWEKELTCGEIGELADVDESTIARRIDKLTKRLLDGEYIECLRNHEKFSQSELDMAREHFVAGLTWRKIAKKQHCSLYSIRKTMKKIRSVIGPRKTRRPGRSVRG